LLLCFGQINDDDDDGDGDNNNNNNNRIYKTPHGQKRRGHGGHIYLYL